MPETLTEIANELRSTAKALDDGVAGSLLRQVDSGGALPAQSLAGETIWGRQTAGTPTQSALQEWFAIDIMLILSLFDWEGRQSATKKARACIEFSVALKGHTSKVTLIEMAAPTGFDALCSHWVSLCRSLAEKNPDRAEQVPRMVQFLSLYDRRCGSYYANNVRAAYLSFADIIAHAGANQADDAAVQRLKLLLTLWDADNGDQPTSGGPAVAKGRPFSERAAGAEGLKRALEELNGLIGLDSVKADVNRLVSYIQVQKARSEIGLRTAEMALHTIFYGNPGTGKTTVARLVARIYREIGVLERGHLVETDRSGLVAGWLGQTALKVQATVKNALGGVLFIDEAYTLAASERGRDEFGFEAIDTLLKLMEDNRGKLIVIAAGYTAPMNRFLNSNPGLKSRFTRSLHFEDYRPEELLAIFRRFCEEADYILSAGADDAVAKFLTTAYSARNDTFGNARLVRNAFEAAARNHASRVEHESSADRRALQTIVAADIQSDEAEGFGSDS